MKQIAPDIRASFDKNRTEMKADWAKVTSIANALMAGLAHEKMSIQGDNIATNVGQVRQFDP